MSSSDRPEALHDLQTAFSAHIRDPKREAAPEGIEDRRMRIYRELFFNNISRLLAANFPVLRQLYDDDGWSVLVREFYTEHRAHTPLFPELPKEFLRYVQEQRENRPGDPPFLLELAHYEWVELALSLDPHELEDAGPGTGADLLDGIPLLSPLAWPLSYRYPVHRIGPGYQPDDPPPEATHLLAYRNRADEVRFMQLNDVTRLLLALLQENTGQCGRRILEQCAERIGYPDPAAMVEHGHSLMCDLLERDVLLGAVPPIAGANKC